MAETGRLRTATADSKGVWRIGRGEDPLSSTGSVPVNIGDSRAGNRFDSFSGNYSVMYFGSTLEACFGETLARYRPDPTLSFINDEWDELNFMRTGSVPSDWRARRTAVRAKFATPNRFVDIEDINTRMTLQRELMTLLRLLGYDDLDIGLVRGTDRRITRVISQYVHDIVDENGNRVYAGIRYLSRLNDDWECWAAFEGTPVHEEERCAILADMPELVSVARTLGLRVF